MVTSPTNFQLEDHTLSAVRDCLVDKFIAYGRYEISDSTNAGNFFNIGEIISLSRRNLINESVRWLIGWCVGRSGCWLVSQLVFVYWNLYVFRLDTEDKRMWNEYTCTGSGKNTWRFCRTVVSGTVGVGNLSFSPLLARLKAFKLPWSAGL